MQGARASVSAGGALAATFSSTADDQWIKIQPAAGKWDLTSDCEVRVRVKNTGTAPITPTARVTSGNSTTDVASLNQPIAPGAEAELVVPFAASTPWKGIPNSGDRTSWDGQPGTGTKFASDAVDGIKISVNRNGATTLLVESITTDAPPIATPAWLGKRPPVEGDWVKTFDDEFTGKSIDTTKWNIYGPNYWDKATHWTKDDLILDGHGVTMRFEKKRGFQNDDPGGNETDYACGYLDSFGKWVQRYGYFEARVKLPTAPGLWPTFWLMPDRGAAAGEQWQREDTANGGMEFDIMEHLDRWGDHRYNIAMH